MNDPQPVRKGYKSLKAKLNEIIAALDDYKKRIEALEQVPIESVVLHDNGNENLIRVTIPGLLIVENLGAIECDCPSNGESGDA
jgi:hypothetical protein